MSSPNLLLFNLLIEPFCTLCMIATSDLDTLMVNFYYQSLGLLALRLDSQP